MTDKKNPNDDYIDPVSPLKPAPLPPEVDEELLAEQRAAGETADEPSGDDDEKSKSARSTGATKK